MRQIYHSIALSAALLTGSHGLSLAQTANAPTFPPGPLLTVSSPAYADGDIIPNKYTQTSTSTPVSMPLTWQNVPAGTQSFTLILHDVDMALNKGSADVLHWMAFNIPGTATGLPEGVPPDAALPNGTIQGKNVAGKFGFVGLGGHGGFYHHYILELYALDTKLDLTSDATRAEVVAAMDGHVLGKSSYEGRYRR